MKDKWNIFWNGFEYEVQTTFRNDSRFTMFDNVGEVKFPSYLSFEEEQEVKDLINNMTKDPQCLIIPVK
jgi:hypothetical protein